MSFCLLLLLYFFFFILAHFTRCELFTLSTEWKRRKRENIFHRNTTTTTTFVWRLDHGTHTHTHMHMQYAVCTHKESQKMKYTVLSILGDSYWPQWVKLIPPIHSNENYYYYFCCCLRVFTRKLNHYVQTYIHMYNRYVATFMFAPVCLRFVEFFFIIYAMHRVQWYEDQ